MASEKKKTRVHYRVWILLLFDALSLLGTDLFVLWVNPSSGTELPIHLIFMLYAFHLACILAVRLLLGVYRQVWRFGGSIAYVSLIVADGISGVICYFLSRLIENANITFIRLVAVFAMNLLICLLMRLVYQFLYVFSKIDTDKWKKVRRLIRRVMGWHVNPDSQADKIIRTRVAIVGAGSIGSMLANELLSNDQAPYTPICFIDSDEMKIGRTVYGLPILSVEKATYEKLSAEGITEIVFAIPAVSSEAKYALYEKFRKMGFHIKTYDFPLASSHESSKRMMRDFSIEDILFRSEKTFLSERSADFYADKTVMVTGGGGSIGSELCRQIATMKPKAIVIVDNYENGAYDIQQDLLRRHLENTSVFVEILSVLDRPQMESIFAQYRPDIVFHAAAHKHVPLMEHNCVEAVRNNVFGTLTAVETAEKFGVQKFIMVSTDKAVNPTNVMGATKRVCEMIVQSRRSATAFSCTRFGNVLGSNGSVIPLFRSQIASGGPVTLTDKRIIRYFMTIPEAVQLVMESGCMARNGDLYVLDMGRPVKILDLAENMIRLSGFVPYKDIDIVETGLRPGEKLYEELLIRSETLGKTENSLIFTERDKPLSAEVIEEKLEVLKEALATGDNDTVRDALKRIVPTYHSPEEVNAHAAASAEMQSAKA